MKPRILLASKINVQYYVDAVNNLGGIADAKYLPEIAEFFGVSTDYLLGRESSEDFTYALYDEITHDLTKDEIEQIKNFANFLRSNKEGDILRWAKTQKQF